jgi:hypothetical protein
MEGLSNQAWEFKHPEFNCGASESLQNIKCKSSKPDSTQVIKVTMMANENIADDGEKDDRTDMMGYAKHLERAYEEHTIASTTSM